MCIRLGDQGLHEIETKANTPNASAESQRSESRYDGRHTTPWYCCAAILECSTAPHCSWRRSSLGSLLFCDTLVVEFYFQLVFILFRPAHLTYHSAQHMLRPAHISCIRSKACHHNSLHIGNKVGRGKLCCSALPPLRQSWLAVWSTLVLIL
jgi:hypothetical protein